MAENGMHDPQWIAYASKDGGQRFVNLYAVLSATYSVHGGKPQMDLAMGPGPQDIRIVIVGDTAIALKDYLEHRAHGLEGIAE